MPARAQRVDGGRAEAFLHRQPPGLHDARIKTGRQVLLEGQVFIGEGAAAIATHFDDHALIARLGFQAMVNVPVRLSGACVGTVNFLWPAATVGPDQIAAARLLGLLAAPDWA